MLKNFNEFKLNEGALPNVMASDFSTENGKDFFESISKIPNTYLLVFKSESPSPEFYLVRDNQHIIMKRVNRENEAILLYYEGYYNGEKYSVKIFK